MATPDPVLAAAWSELGWNVLSAQTGACGELVGNLAAARSDLSPASLGG